MESKSMNESYVDQPRDDGAALNIDGGGTLTA